MFSDSLPSNSRRLNNQGRVKDLQRGINKQHSSVYVCATERKKQLQTHKITVNVMKSHSK